MGYHKARQVARLVWPEDDELHGLEVRVKAIPVGVYMQFTRAFGRPPAEVDEDEIKAIYEKFASSLVEWNLEDEEGEPVPLTLEGLYSQELDFINRLVFAWADSLTTVPEELGKESPSGDQFPEGEIPMEPLSPSR